VARDLHSKAALQPRWAQSGPEKRGWQGHKACEDGPSWRGGVERWGRGGDSRGSACWELTTLWVVRLNNGTELKVTDPKKQQRDVEKEETEGKER